jgi:hypothetical protein
MATATGKTTDKAVPLPQAQMTDPQTGIANTYWYNFFATLATQIAQIKSDVSELVSNVDDLMAGVGRGRFHVDRTGAQTGLTAAAYNLVMFNTERIDNASWFDTGTFRYTPQEEGFYWIYLAVSVAGGATAETTQAALRLNGTDVARSEYATNVGVSAGVFSCARLVPFNGTTDYIEGWIWAPTGVTSIPGGADQVYMGGWKVGELL